MNVTRDYEFTARAVITGALLGVIFGASSLYLVLKVGLTVSASIPVAVISLALFRSLSKLGLRDATILEHNITQTAGSAGEALAFGVGVTMPAILILGFDLEVGRVILVGVLGGMLGILMMIPLRRALIVQEHGKLTYPEGTACAAVLRAGAGENAPGAHLIFTGFAVGLAYKTANVALKLWKDVPEKVFGAPLKAGSVSIEVSPELLGVGYIIGPRIASLMCAGGVLSYLLLIPTIAYFGETAGVVAPGTKPIAEMGPNEIRGAYILYIGAGAVAAGGIISLVRSLPTLWHGMRESFRDVRNVGVGSTGNVVPRTDRDIPMKTVAIGLVILIAAITFAPSLEMNLVGALLIVVFGFLFVAVSSRLTGEIGSTSNPISGMTIATLLFTCLIFLLVGWTGGTHYVTALTVGAIVCIAASNGGTTSQDLKTGFLIGATPKLQQYAIIAGSTLSALALGPILLQLNEVATVYVPAAQVSPAPIRADLAKLGPAEALQGPQARDDAKSYRTWHKTDTAGAPPGKYLVDAEGVAVWLVDPGINGTHDTRPDGSKVRKFEAPKATLMSYIIKGILDRQLPWALVMLGVMISLILELSFLPALAFAVGVYLPLSSSSPIFVGGLIRAWVDRKRGSAEGDKGPGVLLASGYIAGGAIAGILIAFLAGVLDEVDAAIGKWAAASNPFFDGPWSDALSLIPYLFLCGLLYYVARTKAGNK